jgi:ligand-binding SRPBCC domain-containing protein
MRLETFVLRSPMPVSAARLFAWHAEPGAFTRLVPPWERLRLEQDASGLVDGEEVRFRVGRFPFVVRWVARIEAVVPGVSFRDVQVRGPFAAWAHTHRMVGDGPERSILEDSVEYALPAGALGRLLGGAFVRRRLAHTFAYRHRVTLESLGAASAAAKDL